MLVWDDIKKYTKDYSDGIKRVDDKNEVIRQLSGKTKTNNIVHMKELKNDFGLEEKYTIRPFKLKHDPEISDLFIFNNDPYRLKPSIFSTSLRTSSTRVTNPIRLSLTSAE